MGNQRSHRISPLAGELVLSGVGHPGLVPVGRGRRDEVAGETRSVGSWGDGETLLALFVLPGMERRWMGEIKQRLAHWANICTSLGKLGNRIVALEGAPGGQGNRSPPVASAPAHLPRQ